MLANHGSGAYNVTIIAEDVCGLRSEAAVSEVTCAAHNTVIIGLC